MSKFIFIIVSNH